MGAKYSKPSGAIADVKELEYISALLQTERLELRKDGSIEAIDIASFLISRHGIQVTEDEVKETILKEFGRCPRLNEESPDDEVAHADEDNYTGENSSQQTIKRPVEHLDLTQVLALLLIPPLLKAKAKLDATEQNMNKTEVPDQGESAGPSSLPTVTLDSLQKATSTSQVSVTSINPHEYHDVIQTSEDTCNTKFLDKSSNDASNSPRQKRWAINQSEKGDAYNPDADLVENILEMILHDATGDTNPQPLTKDLLRQLLMFYGEIDMANDEELLDEMILAAYDSASEDIERNPIMLDKYTFAKALTNDVSLYNIDNENEVTTNYYDVFQTTMPNATSKPHLTEEDENLQPINTVWTYPSVDYTADTFRSKSFVILLWVTWILSYFGYMFDSQGIRSYGMLNCEENMNNNFGCWVLQGVVTWLIIMLQLSVIGTTFILWASIGNGNTSNPLYAIISMGGIFVFTIYPFFNEFTLSPTDDGYIVSTVKDTTATQQLLYILALLGGFLLILAELRILVQILLPRRLREKIICVRKLLIPGTVQMEAKVKKASSYKVNRLIRNAYSVHKNSQTGISGESETTFGRALLAFSKNAENREELGGLLWMWQKLIKLEIFEEEGCWLTTHLLAGNLAQFTICLFIASFFIYIYRNSWYQSLLEYLPDNQKWRLNASLIYGVAWAEVTTIVNALNYIPSTIRTMIQFRSGDIPSLHDPKFVKYRLAVDQSSLLFGTIFWGTLYTAILIGVCALLFLGVCLWPEFAQSVIILWAVFIGFLVTVFLKWVVLVMMRRYYHRAFYRTKPALANFVSVILESWNLGLTTQHMIFRTLRLLFAASFFIGRVDTPILTPEATFLGPFEIDGYPLIFRKDLLSHEAHRHPYIERLSVMFMMKLRHGKNFGHYAGTCWRLLFTFALVPWMRKYRLCPYDIEVTNFKFAAMRMWTGRMPRYATTASTRTEDNECDGDDESDPNGVIQSLRKQLARLQWENDMLRHAVYHTNNVSPKVSPYHKKHLSMSMPNVVG